MQEIDFYSVKGSNVNRIFNLNLIDHQYYNWDDVKLKIGEDKREEVEKFDLVIVGRKSRLERLKGALEVRGIKFIPHSYLVRNYVMYGRKTCWEVVKMLYMMKVLFEKCDIKAKWERHKINNGQQIYSFEEKDNFYKECYDKYVDLHPDIAY